MPDLNWTSGSSFPFQYGKKAGVYKSMYEAEQVMFITNQCKNPELAKEFLYFCKLVMTQTKNVICSWDLLLSAVMCGRRRLFRVPKPFFNNENVFARLALL